MKTPRPLLCLTLITAAMLFATGCQRAAITESTDPKQAVVGAFQKLKLTPSYYFKRTTKIENSYIEEFRTAPDRYWTNTNFLGTVLEIMRLGEYQYKRVNRGPWQKSTETTPEKAGPMVFRLEKSDPADFSDVMLESKTELDKKPVFVYTYKHRDKETFNTIQRMWLSAETGLPLKIEMGQKEIGDMNTSIFDYEKKIDLTPPM